MQVLGLRMRRRTARRIELGLGRWHDVTGTLFVVAAISGWLMIGRLSTIGTLACAGVGMVGLALLTAQRRVIVDRDEGAVLIEEGVFGWTGRRVIPLFHLRSAGVACRPTGAREHFVLYLEHRAAAPIELDDGSGSRRLIALAKAIAEIGELRYVFDAADDRLN